MASTYRFWARPLVRWGGRLPTRMVSEKTSCRLALASPRSTCAARVTSRAPPRGRRAPCGRAVPPDGGPGQWRRSAPRKSARFPASEAWRCLQLDALEIGVFLAKQRKRNAVVVEDTRSTRHPCFLAGDRLPLTQSNLILFTTEPAPRQRAVAPSDLERGADGERDATRQPAVRSAGLAPAPEGSPPFRPRTCSAVVIVGSFTCRIEPQAPMRNGNWHPDQTEESCPHPAPVLVQGHGDLGATLDNDAVVVTVCAPTVTETV